MADGIYAETLVKRKMTWWGILGYILMGIGVFCAALFIVIGEFMIGGILVVVVGITIFILWRFLKVEYEYVFVTDELQIDRIYSGETRKKGPRITMSNIESVDYATEEVIRKLKEDSAIKIQDFTSHEKETVIYVIRSADQNGAVATLFEPSEKLLATMERVSPRKVHIKH